MVVAAAAAGQSWRIRCRRFALTAPKNSVFCVGDAMLLFSFFIYLFFPLFFSFSSRVRPTYLGIEWAINSPGPGQVREYSKN